jgi:hypothetical protein
MNWKRTIKAAVFILIHALIATWLSSFVSSTWIVTCGILGAAFATLFLIIFAGDEKSAQLFFAENWQELEEIGTPLMGLVITLISLIWFIPVLCLLFTLILVVLRRLDWF